MNGYPIVFSDTGTYLSQAIDHHLGWDRPPFYSLFILPLHMTLTLWPVIVVQALMAAFILHLACRTLLPDGPPWATPALLGGLTVLTWLPWLACLVMPDLFTPLLVVVLGLLALVPARLARRERAGLIVLAAFMIATQQSSLLLWLVLLPALVPLRRFCMAADPLRPAAREPWSPAMPSAGAPGGPPWAEARSSSPANGGLGSPPETGPRGSPLVTGARSDPPASGARGSPPLTGARSAPPVSGVRGGPPVTGARSDPPAAGQRGSLSSAGALRPPPPGGREPLPSAQPFRWGPLALPPLLAMAALLGVNLVGYGRASLSPFGNMFLLARVIYDGPGMAVLLRDCPGTGWRLCAELDRFPPTSDAFLWTPDSPVMHAGGHKAVSAEADAIITAALRAEPVQEVRAFLANWLEQLARFASGDGLEPWPDTVSPWIARDFPPFEQAAYAAARQGAGTLALPSWLRRTHAVVGLAGVVLCLAVLPGGLRRRDPAAGFAVLVLLSLLAGAAITGGLSTPHDRYQSRLMWLPPCIGVLALAAGARAGLPGRAGRCGSVATPVAAQARAALPPNGDVHSERVHSEDMHSGAMHPGAAHSGGMRSGNVRSGDVHSGASPPADGPGG